MNCMKAIAAKLLFPPGWAVTAISLMGYGGLGWTYGVKQSGAPSYFAYVLSAYALVVDIAVLLKNRSLLCKGIRCLKMHSRIWNAFCKTDFGMRYLTNRMVRAQAGLYQSIVLNLLYMAFRLVLGIQYASLWFLSLAGYYLVLGALQAYLVFCFQKRPSGEGRLAYEYLRCKTTGCLLFLLNIPMSAIVVLVVRTNSNFVYPGVVVYLSALYTFYMVVRSVINLVRFYRLDSPILLAAKILNSIATAMSVLGLQTAMISQFGGEDSYRKLMNALTGSGACSLVVAAAVCMIIHSSTMIRKADMH